MHKFPFVKTKLSGFNGYPTFICDVVRPFRAHDLIPPLPNCIARGTGLSYGDAAINTEGLVVSTARLNRFWAFDREQGILTAEAGITLAEICEVIIPAGWFLPVMPGTARISLGGAVCADIHGKNHFHQGSFSQHVMWLELVTASSELVRCSADEQDDLFWATVGGMGLTGLILTVCLKLKRVANSYMLVENKMTSNLDQTLMVLNDKSFASEYSVAWLDGRASVRSFGRGIVTSANHASHEVCQRKFNPKSLRIPFKLPVNLINPVSVNFFNFFYYHDKAQKTAPYYISYQNYFYPLDNIKNWPYLYGRKGFIQYQCLFPLLCASVAIKKLLAIFHRENVLCSLVVLKRFGAANKAPLSFAKEGITIAIDMPFSRKLLSVLNQADALVAACDGRVYLAKDARLSKEMFTRMYPACSAWRKIKQQIDPDQRFQSSLSLRLL